MKHLHTRYFHKQQGAVLIISLIMLVLLTLIGMGAMRSTTMEERMAGNMRDKQVAFYAAEAALREGERFFENLISIGAFNGSAGKLTLADDEPDYWDSSTWSAGNSIEYSSSAISNVSKQPRYIVKYAGNSVSNVGSLNMGRYGSNGKNQVSNFQVTARGTGASDKTQVIVQEYYGKVM